MFNSNTLDTLIAVVIVLLVLSLVVQSVQQGLKKFFKIKSRQIEDSLVDLFEHVLDKTPHIPESWWARVVHHSPLLRDFTRSKHPFEHAQTDGEVKTLFAAVRTKFVAAGRVAQSGKLMLDSIAKQDLLKVLIDIEPAALTPDFADRLKLAVGEFTALKTVIEGFQPDTFAAHLSEDSKNKLAAMQGTLRPLLSDLSAFFQPTAGSPPAGSAGSILNDLMKLRNIRLADVLKLISEAQKAVEEELAKAQQQPNSAIAVKALTAGADSLRRIADGVGSLGRMIEHVLANITKVETWYDTIMQSFEERYARGMKTWGLVISFLVVAVLNANFFTVFKNIATNDTLRDSIIQSNAVVAQRLASTPPDDKATSQTVQAWFKETQSQVANNAQLYTGFGFTPLKPGDAWRWMNGQGGWENTSRWQYWTLPLYTLTGWLIMTLLLSVGAPFWQDTLESLFGIKNVLRKRSDTKNVEDKGGQPNP